MSVCLNLAALGKFISTFIELHTGKETNNIIVTPTVPITHIQITSHQLLIKGKDNEGITVNINVEYPPNPMGSHPSITKLIGCMETLFFSLTEEEKQQVRSAMQLNGLIIEQIGYRWVFKPILNHDSYHDGW